MAKLYIDYYISSVIEEVHDKLTGRDVVFEISAETVVKQGSSIDNAVWGVSSDSTIYENGESKYLSDFTRAEQLELHRIFEDATFNSIDEALCENAELTETDEHCNN